MYGRELSWPNFRYTGSSLRILRKTQETSVKTPSTLVDFYVYVTVRCNKILYNETNQMQQFPKFTPE